MRLRTLERMNNYLTALHRRPGSSSKTDHHYKSTKGPLKDLAVRHRPRDSRSMNLMDACIKPNPDIDGGLTIQQLELNRDCGGGSEVYPAVRLIKALPDLNCSKLEQP